MTFDFTIEGEVKIAIFDYIKNLMVNFPAINTEKDGFVIPAPDGLYDTRQPDNGAKEILNKEENKGYPILTS